MTLLQSVTSATAGDHQGVSFHLPSARRVAIAAGIDRADAAGGNTASIDIKQGGVSLTGYPVSLDLERNLDNISSPSIDPVQATHVSDILPGGNYTYSVTSGTGSPTIEASGAMSADEASGTICPHTFSSHSSPTACMHKGALVAIHAEINTGDRHVSQGKAAVGKVANAIGSGQDEVNDVHHQTGTVLPMADGRLACTFADHNGVLRFMVADDPAGLLTASATDISPTSRRATYSQMVENDDGTIETHNRVRDTSGLGHRVYVIDPDDPGNATQDVLGMSSTLAEQAYPVWSERVRSDLTVHAYAPRATNTDWTGCGVLVRDHSEGANGRYYSIDGTASSTAALGTTSTPRFTQAQYENAVGSSGFRVLDNTGSGQVHIPGNIAYHVEQWDEGTKQLNVLIPYVDAPTMGDFNENTSTATDKAELRVRIAKGATVIDTAQGTHPFVSAFNTIRAGCCVIWKDGVPGGTALLFATEVGNYTDGVTGNPYYKWGGPTLNLYAIEDPFGATDSDELAERITALGQVYEAEGLTIANVDPVRGATNMVSFQEAYEGVTPVGRQSVLRTYQYVEAVSAVHADRMSTSDPRAGGALVRRGRWDR